MVGGLFGGWVALWLDGWVGGWLGGLVVGWMGGLVGGRLAVGSSANAVSPRT